MAFLTSLNKTLSNQRGAIFGLDARVALAIFSVLSVVGGASAVLSVQSIRSKGLAKEMDAFGRAIETMHQDLKLDVFQALITPSDQGAFAALYDPEVLADDRLRTRWLGPYISATGNAHPQFGERIIAKRGAQFSQVCALDMDCYLWLVYASIPAKGAQEVNDLIDGPREPDADSKGRIQWVGSTNKRGMEIAYRVSTAMNTGGLLY